MKSNEAKLSIEAKDNGFQFLYDGNPVPVASASGSISLQAGEETIDFSLSGEADKVVIEQRNEWRPSRDEVDGTYSFELKDGTPIKLKSPTTRIIRDVDNAQRQVRDSGQGDIQNVIEVAKILTCQFGQHACIRENALLSLGIEDFARYGRAVACVSEDIATMTRNLGF